MTPRVRVRAPELRGRRWLNTGGRPVTLAGLRGRIVLLDFWTSCCVNCLHVLDELRAVERRYADVLVVVGVHSPKFPHERDPGAVAAAVERYGVEHPVLDDPELATWQQYAVSAWPTLALVDPEGYVVATMAGEGHADALIRIIDELVAEHTARGTLRRGGDPYRPPAPTGSALRYPGKALALPGGTLLVADSGGHRLVELAADAAADAAAAAPDLPGAGCGGIVLRTIGDGTRGRTDGPAGTARFAAPGGACLLPPQVAAIAGYDVVVADTGNHLLRGLVLATGEVTTVAGSGRPWRSTVEFAAHDSLAADLSSPWDVAWFGGQVIVAMAGVHQLWWFDPVRRTTGAYAGTTVEALRDGPLPEAWLAQPSGLSASPGGDRLWLADSESSALRWVDGDGLHTAVGQGLFDFGRADGPADRALLQHPLGVLACDDGAVLVADTYNGAVRRYDPSTGTVTTVADGLAEPSDLVTAPDGGVIVVESAAHRLVRLRPEAPRPPGPHAPPAGTTGVTARPVTPLAPGTVVLEVIFEPAPGQRLDETYGPALRLEVTASPPGLLVEGGGVTSGFQRRLVLAAGVSEGVLQVVAQAATCDEEVGHAACHLVRQDWGVPVRVHGSGADRLPLVLRGMADPDPAPGPAPPPR